MPTTTNGTVYNDKTFTSSAGYTSTMLVPAALDGTGVPIPTVLYCHGSGTGDRSRSFSDASYCVPLKEALMDMGFMLVEGHVGGDHWGNNRARTAYTALAMSAAAINPMDGIVVYGRSMGGTIATWLATANESTLKPYVMGLYLQAAVQSLYWWSFLKGPDGTGAPGGPAGSYGINDQTSVSEFLTKTAGHDPLTFDPVTFTGMPVLWIHGTDDTTVTFKDNTADQRARVYPYLPWHRVHPVYGADHNTGTGGTFGETPVEIDFLRRVRKTKDVPWTDWQYYSGNEHTTLDVRLFDGQSEQPFSISVFAPIRDVPVLKP